jgi:hypothetical protein
MFGRTMIGARKPSPLTPDNPDPRTLRTPSTWSTLSGTQTLDMSPTKKHLQSPEYNYDVELHAHHVFDNPWSNALKRQCCGIKDGHLISLEKLQKDSRNITMVIDSLIQWVLQPYQQLILSFRGLLNVHLVNHSMGYLQAPQSFQY